MTELVFMYGYPASGKTTYAKNFINFHHPDENYYYLGADEIRKELYGSQDAYGDPEKIYHVLLERMKELLESGRSVVYDACNLFRQYRMDYLTPIRDAGIECYKTVIRMNTTRETCLANHAGRGRDFDIHAMDRYFTADEFPSMDEGWDRVVDVPDNKIPHKAIYVASPFSDPGKRAAAVSVAEHYRKLGHSVVLPLEHKFPNAYDMPNPVWGNAVFHYDIDAIDRSDFVVCLSYGRESTAGTNWEAGYAYGTGKPVLVVEMPGVEVMSLMLMNGSHAVFPGLDALYACDLNGPVPRVIDCATEQK